MGPGCTGIINFWMNEWHQDWKIEETTSLELNQGEVVGRYDPYWKMEQFLGIPFARAPVEDLRWRPPVALESFEDMSKRGNEFQQQIACIQTADMPAGVKMGEDCLRLDLFRPADLKEPASLAIWIHGGSFFYGTGMDPYFNVTKLTSMGNIVAKINYRMGLFGFMNTYNDIEGYTEGQGSSGSRIYRIVAGHTSAEPGLRWKLWTTRSTIGY